MNYKDTLNLPQTKFSMKANLPNKEPVILEDWQKQDLYGLIRKKSRGKAKYILHDGPPYANGDIHIGHALNKTLKDIVVKYKTMRGFDSPYVPGWDCHGLPVEHQLFKELGITKHHIDQVKFRKKAHKYAAKYVGIQKEQFKRLGIFGEWENPYLTLNKGYEEDIVKSFGKLVEKAYVYKGLKPISWCVKCETALAEAEVEYNDHTSPSVYVKFKLTNPQSPIPNPCFFVIWTTTPWTLLGNVAIALNPDMEYVFLQRTENREQRTENREQRTENREQRTEVLVFAKDLIDRITEAVGLKNCKVIKTVKGKDLEGLECQHPFVDRASKVVLADYVSNEEGTGCVHTAPGHGHEDYQTGLKYKLPVVMPVDAAGKFDKTTGDFAGAHVFKANKQIIERMKKDGSLLASGQIQHSYPHCWRCKEPIIVRATAQWFINVDHKDLRKRTLDKIKKISWVPPVGENRISTMVENRPDWCLSRQRYWGVPIPVFYCKECQAQVLEAKVIYHIAKLIKENGSDIWFMKSASELLPKGTQCKKCKSKDFDKETDILDVWFDSGVSHQAVLKKSRGLEYPASLYLEGSDQHRGWFQTALLTAMSIVEKEPFRQVLTHGFVVDGEGRKMSKSLGNVISPLDIIKECGADVLRLWVSASDYNVDIRISDEILGRVKEAYKKLRNTFKFILGNTYDFDPKANSVTFRDMQEIDRWILSKLTQLTETVTDSYEKFEFHKIYRSIYNFCTIELSSFYLDIIKDRLYTFAKNDIKRRSSQTALYELISVLTRLLAPIMPHTTEEAWSYMPDAKGAKSVHLADWPKADAKRKDKKLDEAWQKLTETRSVVLKALEEKRGSGFIGNSLQAAVTLNIKDAKLYEFLKKYQDRLPAIFIVSEAVLRQSKEGEFSVTVDKARGQKCPRCWNFSEDIGKDKKHPEICKRCIDAVEAK